MKSAPVFDDVLEAVDALPIQQQEDIVRILKSRMIDQKREVLAESVREARAEYASGKVRKGTIADLMQDLDP